MLFLLFILAWTGGGSWFGWIGESVWEGFDGFKGMERGLGRTDSLLYEQ